MLTSFRGTPVYTMSRKTHVVQNFLFFQPLSQQLKILKQYVKLDKTIFVIAKATETIQCLQR